MKKQNIKDRFAIGIFIISIIATIVSFYLDNTNIDLSYIFGGFKSNTVVLDSENITVSDLKNADLLVCVMSIGQADSIYIKQGEKSMLIDCGEYDSAEKILDRLSLLDVKKLDVLVLTHPHSDHIGGAKKIIENVCVDRIYMPNVSSPTITFDKLLDCISRNEIKVFQALSGTEIPFADANITILSPEPDHASDNLNTYSAVVFLKYNDIKMLFCADAEKENEDMILSSGYDIQCDFIKIGHHGSRDSSSEDFVSAADPVWAVATTVYDSDDDLPKKEVLDRWKSGGANVLCTHSCGDIYAVVCDGELSVYTEHSPST